MTKSQITPWVVGNWKQNPKTQQEVRSLVDGLSDLKTQNCRVAIAPSMVHLPLVADWLPTATVMAQDVCHTNADTGAYTGDVSAAQLAACGVKWVIIGHSERRTYHNEDNVVLVKKITHAVSANLGVVLCVGESREMYEAGKTQSALTEQLFVFEKLAVCLDKVLIAYEPVWAIGTGLTPTTAEIEAVHQFIKTQIVQYGLGEDTPILYGGSVNDKNVLDFSKSPHINGVLVGNASLNPDNFRRIVDTFSNIYV